MEEVSHNTRPQFLRRDFLVGSVAGFVATKSATLTTNGWTRIAEGPTTSYAQAGEDVIVAGILEQFNLTRTTYLDVGAFLPIYSNNTYLFYQKGNRGVLVEPNIDLIPALKPKVICTETLVPTTPRMDPETTKFLASHGYEVRGMTCANTIYLDQSRAG
jgi:hypothetical protein